MRLRRRPQVPVAALASRVPVTAVLSHDLARAVSAATGRPVTLDDLERWDRIAALLVDRWEPRVRRSTQASTT